MYFVWLLALTTPAVMYYIWQTTLLNKRNIVVKRLEAIDSVFAQRLELIPKMLKIYQSISNADKALVSDVEVVLKDLNKDYNKYIRDDVANHLYNIDKLNYRVGRVIISSETIAKKDPIIVQAMAAYEATESSMAPLRKAYNESASDLNETIAVFPNSFVAEMYKMEAMPLFTAEQQSNGSDKEF